MKMLRWYADRVDAANDLLGRSVSWLMLPVVLVAFAVVCLRYAFAVGYPWLQETYIWLHGMAFTLASAWVLKDEGHVRVDLVYKRLTARAKAWLDLVGVFVFLLPMMGLLLWWSWPVVQRSWRLMERSPTADGLQFVFVLKSFLLALGVLLVLQGLAMAARCLLVIAGVQRGGREHGHG